MFNKYNNKNNNKNFFYNKKNNKNKVNNNNRNNIVNYIHYISKITFLQIFYFEIFISVYFIRRPIVFIFILSTFIFRLFPVLSSKSAIQASSF